MTAPTNASNGTLPRKSASGARLKGVEVATPAPEVPGYMVSSPCGRQWFVSLDAVAKDYAQFLVQADHLTPQAAAAKVDENRDFLPTWFAEQVSTWEDIEFLGRLVTKSKLFKTKAALDRRRGSYCGDYAAETAQV